MCTAPEAREGDLVRRTEAWLEAKTQRLNEMRENRKEEGAEECTFKPRLVTQERPVVRREKASTSR